MKKRLLSLFLGMVMLLGVFLVSCSSKTDEDAINEIVNSASEDSISLVLMMPKEEGTTDEAAKAVSDALSEITKSKYKINLVVRYVSEDEYYEKLEANLAKMQECVDNDEYWYEIDEDNEDETRAEETVLDEYGIPTTKYPVAADFQADVFYFGGYERYLEYINNGWLYGMKAQLTGEAMLITDYVSPLLLEGIKVNTVPYAIPNNHTIGQYTYMLINKEVADKYYYSSSLADFQNVTSLTVARFLADCKVEGLVPVNGTMDDYLLMLANYWNISPTDPYTYTQAFSLVGEYIKDIHAQSITDGIQQFTKLLSSSEYVSALRTVEEFYLADYFGKGTNYGITFVTGDASLPDTLDHDKYYSVVVRYPVANNEDVYTNLLGVSNMSQSPSRAMRIVTLLNTDAEFRNLLQYGIQNVNYELTEDGLVHRLNNEYMMDIAKTGNMFLAYPDVENGYAADAWEYGKKQNQEAVLSKTVGFTFKANLAEDEKIDESLLFTMRTLNNNALKAFKACTTIEAFDAKISELQRQNDSDFSKFINTSYKLKNKNDTQSPATVYQNWAIQNGYVVVEQPAEEDDKDG